MFINGGQSDAGKRMGMDAGGDDPIDHIERSDREEAGSSQGGRGKVHMGSQHQLHSVGQPRGLLRR